jgi:hypothetical protein
LHLLGYATTVERPFGPFYLRFHTFTASDCFEYPTHGTCKSLHSQIGAAAEGNFPQDQTSAGRILPAGSTKGDVCRNLISSAPQGLLSDFNRCFSFRFRLESVLRSFVAITTGDKLQITYEDKLWSFDVLGPSECCRTVLPSPLIRMHYCYRDETGPSDKYQ